MAKKTKKVVATGVGALEHQLERMVQRAFDSGVREGRRQERDRLRGKLARLLGGKRSSP